MKILIAIAAALLLCACPKKCLKSEPSICSYEDCVNQSTMYYDFGSGVITPITTCYEYETRYVKCDVCTEYEK